jgi:rare lipoprotein A
MRAAPTRLALLLIALVPALPMAPAWASGPGQPEGQAGGQGRGPGQGWTDQGEASWYGPRHAGRRTTSGERFDPTRLTAAHPSLPLGSFVRVTDDDTGRSIVVRINDREPAHGVRVIDLSRAAASRLGIVGRGTAMVTLAEATPEEYEEVAEAPAGPARPALRSRARHRRLRD